MQKNASGCKTMIFSRFLFPHDAGRCKKLQFGGVLLETWKQKTPFIFNFSTRTGVLQRFALLSTLKVFTSL
jgi:hypothetical protein